MKNSLWQTIVGVLSSTLLTGAGCWMVFGQDKVDRSDMVDYVQNQAPWVRERGQIHAAVKSNQKSTDKLEAAVGRLVQAQHELIVEQLVLVTKVDELLSR